MLSAKTKLNDIIPVIGLGTWNMSGKECVTAVESSLEMGYRHIDTAQMYGNEKEVGEGMKNSGVARNDIFLTTKVATSNLTSSRVRSSFEESLKKLDSDYVDLFLIHWPTSSMDLKSCLEAMFELVDEGKLKYVGVSNFSPELFRESLEIGTVVNNQVKFSPYDTPFSTLDVIKETGTTLTAYSPLEQGKASSDNSLKEMGKKYNKTASQVILRWLVQLGDVSVIPKASSEKHQHENLDIFNFNISEDDMKRINSFSG